MALRDVFIIREASMHAWRNLGFSPEVKAYFEKRFGSIAYEMGIMAAPMFEHNADITKQSDGRTDPAVAEKMLEHDNHPLMDYEKIFKKNPKVLPVVRKMAPQFKVGNADAWNELDQLISDLAPEPEGYEGVTFLNLPEGWKWVEVQGDECRGHEGKKMQHCGGAYGKMLSLRDPKGKPHVTVELNTEGPELTLPAGMNPEDWHITEVPRGLAQIKGKQNEVPDKKYWPAIMRLVQKLPTSMRAVGEFGDEYSELRGYLARGRV